MAKSTKVNCYFCGQLPNGTALIPFRLGKQKVKVCMSCMAEKGEGLREDQRRADLEAHAALRDYWTRPAAERLQIKIDLDKGGTE